MPFIDESQLDPIEPQTDTSSFGGQFITEDMLDPLPSNEEFFSLDTLKNLGKATTRNVGGLAGLLADYNPLNPMNAERLGQAGVRFYDYLAGNTTPSVPTNPDITAVSPTLEALRQEFVGDPNYKSNLERYAVEATAAAPLAFSSAPSAVISAAASGAGAELGKDMGINPLLTSFLAGVTPSAVTGAWKSLVGPLSRSGQEGAAGAIIKEFAGPEGIQNLEKAIASGADVGPFGPKTFGELAKTPGAAALQTHFSMVPGENGGDSLLKLLAERQGNRVSALQDIAPSALLPEKVPPEVRGAEVRRLGQPVIDREMRIAQEQFRGMDREAVIPFDDARQNIKAIAESTLKDRVVGLKGDAKNLLSDLTNDNASTISLNKAQKLLEESANIASDVGASNPQYARMFQDIRDEVAGAVEQAADNGSDAASKFLEMQKNYREAAQTYKNVIGQNISGKGAYGVYQTLDENVLKNSIEFPTRAKEFMAAFGDKPAMVQQARGALLDKTFETDPGTWIKRFDQKRSIFRELFGEDYKTVKKVIDDLASEGSVKEMTARPTKGQAWTGRLGTVAQTLSSMEPKILKLLENKVTLLLGTGVGSASMGGILGPILGLEAGDLLSKVAASSRVNFSRLLVRSMTDPKLAKALVRKATPGAIEAATSALARQVVRSGIVSYSEAGPTSDRGIKKPQTPRSENFPLLSRARGETTAAKDRAPLPLSQGSGAIYKQKEILGNPSPNSTTPTPLSKDFNTKLDQALEKALRMIDEGQPMERKTSTISDEFIAPLADAVQHVESRGKANAVSNKGATGLMQIMPDTGREIAKELGIKEYDLKDPTTNRMFGEYYLKKMLAMFKGDVELALAAYNAGPGRVREWIKQYGDNWKDIASNLSSKGHYAETVNYVPAVKKRIKTIEV